MPNVFTIMTAKKMKLRDAVQGYMLRCQSKRLSFRTIEWYEQELTCRTMEREVGIHPETAQHVWTYVNKFRQVHNESEQHVFLNRYGKPLTDTGVAQTIADAGRRAGLSGVRVSPHTFRHTFAMMYLEDGGDLYKLSRLLDHGNINTTEEYLKNFNSRQARRDQDSFSPINRLNRSAKQGRKRSGGMFE